MATRPPGYWKRYYQQHREQLLKKDRERRRRASESEREKRLEYNRAYYREHKEKYKKTPEQRRKHNASRRTKYAGDPEYRKKLKEDVKKHRAAHPEVRLARELRRWGITVEQYRAAVAAGCAICGRGHSNDRRKHRFHADHCHVTGAFRGFLCSSCNLGLGKFGHDPERRRRSDTVWNV